MEAFGHGAGIWLPHSTYAMLGSRHLHRCRRQVNTDPGVATEF